MNQLQLSLISPSMMANANRNNWSSTSTPTSTDIHPPYYRIDGFPSVLITGRHSRSLQWTGKRTKIHAGIGSSLLRGRLHNAIPPLYPGDTMAPYTKATCYGRPPSHQQVIYRLLLGQPCLYVCARLRSCDLCYCRLYCRNWDCHFHLDEWFYHGANVQDVQLVMVPIHQWVNARVRAFVLPNLLLSPFRLAGRKLHGHLLSLLHFNFNNVLEDLYTKYCWCVFIEKVLTAWTTSSSVPKFWPLYVEPSSTGGGIVAYGIEGLATTTSALLEALSNSGVIASM